MKNNVKPVPDGYHTVTPYLVVADAARQIAFVAQAFGAREMHRHTLPDGSVTHAEVQIGDSKIMLGQARDPFTPRPCNVYLYVEDADAAYRQALQAGAKSVMEVKDQFYGDRSGGVEDSNGNYWWIATHIEDVSPEEIERRFAAMGRQHSV